MPLPQGARRLPPGTGCPRRQAHTQVTSLGTCWGREGEGLGWGLSPVAPQGQGHTGQRVTWDRAPPGTEDHTGQRASWDRGPQGTEGEDVSERGLGRCREEALVQLGPAAWSGGPADRRPGPVEAAGCLVGKGQRDLAPHGADQRGPGPYIATSHTHANHPVTSG